MGLETLNYRSWQLWSVSPEKFRQINLLVQLKKAFENGVILTIDAYYVRYTCQALGFCRIYLLVIHIYKHIILAWKTADFLVFF